MRQHSEGYDFQLSQHQYPRTHKIPAFLYGIIRKHTNGSYLFMPPCFPHLHRSPASPLPPLLTQGRERPGMRCMNRIISTSYIPPLGHPCPVRLHLETMQFYPCCLAGSADTGLLMDCAVCLFVFFTLEPDFIHITRCYTLLNAA